MMDIGPVELMVLLFPGMRADPAVAEVLSGVVSRGHVTVLDMVFITQTSDGRFRITDVDENRHDTGLGSLEIKAQPLISEGDLDVVRGYLKPGTSAAVIAYEHSWVRHLAGAVTHAGGIIAQTPVSAGTASVTADATGRRAPEPAGQQRRFAAYESRQQAEAESGEAVRQAEAEAAAAEQAAEQYATYQPPSTADDSVVSRLDELANLRESGALTQQEFDSAKAKLLGA
jgi:hypothetical protein